MGQTHEESTCNKDPQRADRQRQPFRVCVSAPYLSGQGKAIDKAVPTQPLTGYRCGHLGRDSHLVVLDAAEERKQTQVVTLRSSPHFGGGSSLQADWGGG